MKEQIFMQYLNGIDDDLIDEAVNVERFIPLRIRRRKRLLHGAAGAAACFVFLFCFWIMRDTDMNNIIVPTDSNSGVSGTLSQSNVNEGNQSVSGYEDVILWNTVDITSISRKLAQPLVEVTKEVWLETFPFMLPQGEISKNVRYSLGYSIPKPESGDTVKLVGGWILFNDGLEESEQWMSVNINKISPEFSDPFIGSESDVMIGDVIVSNPGISQIGQTKAVLSKNTDESGIWGTHIYGLFVSQGYRITIEGRNSEDMVIDFIKAAS
jgi:hypothetical protein